MPPYSITYKPSAAEAFRKIHHPSDRSRIKEAIEQLAQNPRPQGHVQLTGGAGECRIRVGQYRVVYDTEDQELLILVLRVGIGVRSTAKSLEAHVQTGRPRVPRRPSTRRTSGSN